MNVFPSVEEERASRPERANDVLIHLLSPTSCLTFIPRFPSFTADRGSPGDARLPNLFLCPVFLAEHVGVRALSVCMIPSPG